MDVAWIIITTKMYQMRLKSSLFFSILGYFSDHFDLENDIKNLNPTITSTYILIFVLYLINYNVAWVYTANTNYGHIMYEKIELFPHFDICDPGNDIERSNSGWHQPTYFSVPCIWLILYDIFALKFYAPQSEFVDFGWSIKRR